MMGQNKVGVVTGASGGIGFSFAEYLAQQGYDLLLTACQQDKLEVAAAELMKKYPVHIQAVTTDLAEQDCVTKLVAQIGQLPRIDILVNSAGFGERKPFYQEHIISIHKMISVHISSVVELVHAVLPVMIKQQSGSIITVSSLAAFIPAPGSSVYSATKSFLNTFMESLHMEVEEFNIRVQSLCPGLTHTNFHNGSDVERNIAIRGVDVWMEADEVVRASMKGLEAGEVVCIPGFLNKVIGTLTPTLPRKVYYAIADKAAERFK